jgi:glycosyltransferase involved in cell wall biosynthesis
MHLIGPAEEDPKYYEECLDLMHKYKLENMVHFHGPQNVASFLEDIDLVIMSSHSEALPVVVLEAMAAGVPIISTNVGSVHNILCRPLEDNAKSETVHEAGLVVPPQSPQDLTSAVIKILKDKVTYEKCISNGPKRVQHSFKIEDIMKQYTGLYAENL